MAGLGAAASPANVPYLYFVATADGHHEFRMTLEQHTSAVRQVRAESPRRKPAPRMLAMAPAGASSRPSAAAPSKTASRATTTTPAKTASKSTSKTIKSTSQKSTGHAT